MKHLISLLFLTLALFSTPALASMRVFNSSGTQIGIPTDIKFANGLSASIVSGKAQIAQTPGDGTTAMAGFLHAQYSTSGDLTAAKCGYTVSNDNTGGSSALYNLPAISASLLGCRMTFIVGTSPAGSKRLWINPTGNDRILLLTNAGGDAISGDQTGQSVVLEATQPGWAPVGKEQGTWYDIN